MTRTATSPLLPIWLFLSGAGYAWLGYGMVRGDFGGGMGDLWGMIAAFGLLGVGYLWMLGYMRKSARMADFYWALAGALGFRLLLIAHPPNLSDDFYRFIWDGRLWHLGFDPLASTPAQWFEAQSATVQSAFSDLYPHLNSEDYFTVYPPLLQWVFRFATWLFPTGITGPVIVMKAIILLAECGSLYLIHRLVQWWKLPRQTLWVYTLNPLVILELSGNLHFEAFMGLGLMMAIYFFQKQKEWLGSVGFSFAIGAKLIPVLFFPFLFWRLGWKKWLLYGALTAALCVLLFLPWLNPQLLANMGASLKLYYQYFAYNASVYYLLSWASGGAWNWILGKILPWITVGLIITLAAIYRSRDWRTLPAMLLVGYGLYEMLATTVHPWYMAPLVAMAALTRYRWAVLWSLLILFTYIAYWFQYHQSPWLLWAEYLLVLGFAGYEWLFVRSEKTLEEWVLGIPFLKRIIAGSIPKRVAIKEERIFRLLPQGGAILDMGTGNGGLVRALRLRGVNLTSVDVKDISFFPEVKPVIYNGTTLPFPDQSFDCVTIVTVLHHTPDPEVLLREALRVSRSRIVIMEDIYRNPVQKHLTFFMDSLVNLEFAGHPHTNRNHAEWMETFQKLGLKVVHEEQFRTLGLFRQVVWALESV